MPLLIDAVWRVSRGRLGVVLRHLLCEEKVVVRVQIAVEGVFESVEGNEGSWIGKTCAEHHPRVYKLWIP